MKKITRYTALILLMVMSLPNVFAQTVHSAYFLETMPNRHEMNPALTPDFGYTAVPVAGALKIGVTSNLGLADILYPRGNELVTGLHQSVSAEQFLGNLNKMNSIEAEIKTNIVSVGFHAFGGLNTIGINARSMTGIYLPYELFKFAKVGQENGATTEYNIENLAVTSDNYAELALGHSHKIGSKLTIGAKVKFLFGIASAEANVDRLNLMMSADKWIVKSRGHMFTSSLLKVTYDKDGMIDNVDTGDFSADNFGVGFDVGAKYDILPNLKVSAAVVDMGFVSWKGHRSNLIGEEFVFDGFHNLGAEKDPATDRSAWDDELDQLEEDAKGLIRFEEGKEASRVKTLASTLNLGVEYGILNNKITFGLLSSTRFGMPKVWAEGMLSVNFKPVSWFSASVNGSASNTGCAFGALINFAPKGFNFFIGSDYIPYSYSKEGIPLHNAAVNAVMGINITFNHK